MSRKNLIMQDIERMNFLDEIRKLPRDFKICMFTSIIVGLLAYAYVLLNPIFIHDGSSMAWPRVTLETFFAGADRMTWLSNKWYVLQDFTQVPWFAGILSIFIYGISCYLSCKALCIKSDICLILISGVMVVQPAIISSQMYGAGGLVFSIALLFSSLAVWAFFLDNRFRYLLFFVFLIVTVGTYTPYICWTAVVLLIREIRDLLEINVSLSVIWLRNLKATLVSGLAIYTNVRICSMMSALAGVDMQDRTSFVSMYGILGLIDHMKDSFWMIVKEFLPPSIVDEMGRGGYFYSTFTKNRLEAWFFYVALAFSVVMLLVFIIRQKNSIVMGFHFLLHAVALFLSMDLLAYITDSHVLMSYGHAAPWILMISQLEIFIPYFSKEDVWEWVKVLRLRMIYHSSVVLMALYTIYSFSLMANVGYMRTEAAFRSGCLLANRIAVRLESIEGYTPGETPVYFMGSLDDYGHPPYDEFPLSDVMTGVSISNAYTYSIPFKNYLKEQVGINVKYAVEPAIRRMLIEEYAAYLYSSSGHFGISADFFSEKFQLLYDCTEDYPMTENYFWIDGILVFRLRTK